MNKEQRLKANIAAAELLGYEYITHKLDSGDVSIKLHCNSTRLFNIFTNPADFRAAVKKLLLAHGYTMHYTVLDRLYFYEDSRGRCSDCAHATYEEAVGEACLAIK